MKVLRFARRSSARVWYTRAILECAARVSRGISEPEFSRSCS